MKSNFNSTEMNHFDFARIGLAVPKLFLANVTKNLQEHKKLIKKAYDDNVQILCFPELSITGYTCGDLFHQQTLIEASQDAIIELVKFSNKFNSMLFIIGTPFSLDGVLYNTAAVIKDGKLLAIIPKTYLPNYEEYKEKIYFTSSPNFTEILSPGWYGDEVYFGRHLIFEALNDQNLKIGIEICEDLWAVEPPSNKLALYGATVLLNLSASNNLAGKSDYRDRLVEQQSERCLAIYGYVSSGLGESSTDLIFGGQTMMYESGVLLGELPEFQYASKLLICDVDLGRIQFDRIRNTVWGESVQNNHAYDLVPIPFETKLLDFSEIKFQRKINQKPFLPGSYNSTEGQNRFKEILYIQANALTIRTQRAGAKKLLIAVSGGLDSTYTLLVCLEAMKILKWKNEDIIPITMPAFGTSETTLNLITNLCKQLKLDLKIIDIKNILEEHFKALEHDKTPDLTFENAQARERSQILFDYANKINGLVVGTGDLSEFALGWMTYSGDHMSSYAINSGVPKTLIQEMVLWLANTKYQNIAKKTLYEIINTPISPELIPPKKNKISQVTEDIIGPFELHDFFLFNMIRYRFSPQKILFLAIHAFDNKYSIDELKHWLIIFIKRFFKNQFKRSSSPDGIKVGSVSLSPRANWRMPSDAQPDEWIKSVESFTWER